MEVPEETLEQLRTIKAALDELEEHMQPFLEVSLTPIEQVKANLALAQAVAVLFQLHSRLNASKLENHPVQKDLERLAIYEKKVMKALTANDLARSKPGTSLNIAAANRFIDAAIPDLSAEQKQQLRNLSQPAVSKAAVSSNRSQKQQKQEQQQQQLQDCHVSSEQLAAEDLNEERTQRAGNGSEYSHPAASGAPVDVSVQQHGTEAGGRIGRDKKQGKRKAPSAVDDAGAFLLEVMRNLE